MSAFEFIINELNEMIEEAWNFPMMGGKCVIDGKEFKERIDKLIENYPTELKRAQAIIAERENILKKAKAEAQTIINEANAKAKMILNEQEIVKEAGEKAKAMLVNAQLEASQLKKASISYADNLLKKTEELYENSLSVIKQARRSINQDK